MKAEAKVYRRENKDKITSLLSLSGLWPEDSQQPRRIIFLGSTVSAEGAIFYAHWNSTSTINLKKVNDVDGITVIFNSFIFFVTKIREENLIYSMDAKLSKYRFLRDLINKLLLWSGIWPYPEDTVFFYRIISFMAILMYFTYGARSANISKVSVCVRVLGIAFGMYTLVIKVVSFLVYHEDLVLLDKELGYAFEKELKNKANRSVLLEGLSVFTGFLYFVSGFVAMSALLFYSVPIVYALKYKKYGFIYEGKYPFPVEPGTPLYWIVLIYEASTVWFTINVTNSVDNAFGLHCFRACGLLRLVAQRWEQLQPNDFKSKQQLRECVQMHQLVIRSMDSLQRVYRFIVLWNYVAISLIMCSLMWQADQIKNHTTPIRLTYFISYIMIKSMQAFTYAYYGSLVSQESENYQEGIFFSDWPGSGKVQLMKDLLIVHAQRIITLKACGFFCITMKMFENIMHTTLSYFFLLQTVESKH